MNTCTCLNLILVCIVYWQACEISRVLSECDPLANGIDLSLLEHVSPIEWDNVVLYGQYILDRKLVRGAVAQKGSSLAYKITQISLVPDKE
jgi:Tn3 transposase DDE domain